MSCSCTVRTFEPKIFRKKSTSSPQHTLEDYCKSKLLYIKQPVKFLQNIYSSTTHLTRIPFVFLRGCRLYEISRPEDEKALKKKKKKKSGEISFQIIANRLKRAEESITYPQDSHHKKLPLAFNLLPKSRVQSTSNISNEKTLRTGLCICNLLLFFGLSFFVYMKALNFTGNLIS